MYAISDDSIFVKACNRVLITSNGFTTNADVEPATQPHKNDHQKTASPISIENSLLNVNKQFIFLMQTQNQNFFQTYSHVSVFEAPNYLMWQTMENK